MKSIIHRFWPAILLALLCIAPNAFATQTTVDVTGAGNYAPDGIFISPYYATVGGASNTTIICDDFADDTHLNVTWTASVLSFSNLASNLGSTLWGSWFESAAGGSVKGQTIVQWYEEAAWLSIKLLQQPTGTASQANYSYAEWAVFDPQGVFSFLRANNMAACNAVFGAANCLTSTGYMNPAANSLLWSAQQNYMNGNYSNFAILTPLVNGVVCSPALSGHGNCPAQEFFEMLPVAEGGAAALYLLLAAATCFGAMYFRSPRPNPHGQTA